MDYLTIFLIAVFSYAVLVTLTYISFKLALESKKATSKDATACNNDLGDEAEVDDIEKNEE